MYITPISPIRRPTDTYLKDNFLPQGGGLGRRWAVSLLGGPGAQRLWRGRRRLAGYIYIYIYNFL